MYSLTPSYPLPPSLEEKRRKKWHLQPQHPICQLKNLIYAYLSDFETFDALSEVVHVKECFDALRFPADHPARRPTDTFYLDEVRLLRPHMTAHQTELLGKGYRSFLASGDVFRKDTIDKNHYPVFYQTDGVKLLPTVEAAAQDLRASLAGLIQSLFPGIAYRFLDDAFPYTIHSLQAEALLEGEWVEILGGGVIHPQILLQSGIFGSGWAFGLGLDRLVRIKCHLPDIRYLWSEDPRFTAQFAHGLTRFQAFSHYPPIHRDVSFWITGYEENQEGGWQYHNDFCGLARELGQDLVEQVRLLDKFQQHGQVSLTYRLTYRSFERTLTNELINVLHQTFRQALPARFHLTLR